MKPILIGLTGKARSGKDTVAAYLEERYNTHTLSFAAPIKAMTCELLDITLSELEKCKDEKFSSIGCSPRRVMQTLGTDWGRAIFGNDIWIKMLQHQIDDTPPHIPLVISDVRFENEAEMIREQGGVIWHIYRSKLETEQFEVPPHASEKGVKMAVTDTLIRNVHSLDYLQGAIEWAWLDTNRKVTE